MNILTALQLTGAEGFEFVGEKGANINFGSNSISEIVLRKEYQVERNVEGNRLSGVITSISKRGITLNDGKIIPYQGIKELRVTPEIYGQH